MTGFGAGSFTPTNIVIPGLVPGIHSRFAKYQGEWVPATSAGTTLSFWVFGKYKGLSSGDLPAPAEAEVPNLLALQIAETWIGSRLSPG